MRAINPFGACVAALAFVLAVATAQAQQTTDRVDAKRDWSVFCIGM